MPRCFYLPLLHTPYAKCPDHCLSLFLISLFDLSLIANPCLYIYAVTTTFLVHYLYFFDLDFLAALLSVCFVICASYGLYPSASISLLEFD